MVTALTVAALLSFALPGPVGADWVDGGSHVFTGMLTGNAGTQYCGRGMAKIGYAGDRGDGQSLTRAAYWNPSSCVGTGALTVPGGWLGGGVWVYRDGAICSGSGIVTSSVNLTLSTVIWEQCADIPGTHTYRTTAAHRIWHAADETWMNGVTYSPGIDY